MKYIYQVLSYIVVILVVIIIYNNLNYAKNIDYKNEIKSLHRQNDSLKANIDSNQVIITSLSSEIKEYKDTIVLQLNQQKETQARLHQRLDNPGYMKSAPERVITQTQEQLASSLSAIGLLEKELSRFSN